MVRTVALLLLLILAVVALAARHRGPTTRLAIVPATLAWRWSALLPVALVTQVGGGALTRGSARAWPVEACYVLLLCWIGANLKAAGATLRRGLVLVAAGVVLNLIPISLDGGMPVSASALRAVGAPRFNPATGHLYRYVLGHGGVSGVLGDVFGVSSLQVVLSVGDFVLVAGLALVAYAWVRAGTGFAAEDARDAGVSVAVALAQ